MGLPLMNVLSLSSSVGIAYIDVRGYGEYLFFQESGQSDKSDNLEQRTSHVV
jgi:hypothetical protein